MPPASVTAKIAKLTTASRRVVTRTLSAMIPANNRTTLTARPAITRTNAVGVGSPSEQKYCGTDNAPASATPSAIHVAPSSPAEIFLALTTARGYGVQGCGTSPRLGGLRRDGLKRFRFPEVYEGGEEWIGRGS